MKQEKSADSKDELIKVFKELEKLRNELAELDKGLKDFEDKSNFTKIQIAKLEAQKDYLERRINLRNH